jgi:hypothetical protein
MTHDIATLEGSARIVFSLCVAVVGGLAAMVGAIFIVAWEASTFWTVVAGLVGGAVGVGIGMLIANALGWRWRQSPVTPADGWHGCPGA